MGKRFESLTAALLAAAVILSGCARLRAPSNEGHMLLFSAVGELRPVAPAGSLFGPGREPLGELKPSLAGRSLVMAGLAGGFDCDPADGAIVWQNDWTGALSAANIRVLILADDHALDCGRPALADGMNRLLLREFYLAGAGPDQKMARAPVYLSRDGLTLGVVAFLTAPLPGDSCAACPGPALYDRRAMIAALNEMKSRSNFRVAVLHFPERPAPALTADEQATAREAVDYGADLVLGYGPTAAGGIMRVRGHWVIGSLGRALGGDGSADCDCDGLLLSAEFTPEKIMNLRLLPVALDDGRPRLLRGAEATAVLQKIIAAAPADAAANMNLIGDILYLK